jgi:hypothetical protein
MTYCRFRVDWINERASRLKGDWKLLVKFLVAKLIFIHFLPLLQIPRREAQGRRTAPP